MTQEVCPHCGAEVPPRARACPDCGSDESTGWADMAEEQRLGAPDDSFDYNEFVANEFGAPKAPVRPYGIRWIWWVTAVLLIILLAFSFF